MRQQRRELQERQRAAKAGKAVSERATKILLVRHGETTWNFERRYLAVLSDMHRQTLCPYAILVHLIMLLTEGSGLLSCR